MALEQERLEGKILNILDFEAEQIKDPEESRRRFAALLAKAVVEEIKEAKINYESGLAAPSGAVTGIFNGKLS